MQTKIVYQLHRGGQPIAKQHSTFGPCVVEAAERGLLVRASGHAISLADGCEIMELEVPRPPTAGGLGHSF